MLTSLEHERRIHEAEVAWIVSKRAAAMRSRDADWLAARYLPGAPVVGPTPPVTRIADPSRDAVRLWEWFELLQGRIRWSSRIERVRMNGDQAICRCVEQVSVRAWTQARVRMTLTTTVALRRVAEVWLIEWEHAVEA
ncbi:YybH family protein [Agromyces sp. NPDC055661]|jgi:ketosteroid isomerase-like protein